MIQPPDEPVVEPAGPPPDPDQGLIDQILEPFKKKESGGYRMIRTYLDFAVEKETYGRVEIDLTNVEKCPKATANFLALCTGAKDDLQGKTVSYKGSKAFRMVPKFCMCAGDILNDNGTDGTSIFMKKTFDDEKSSFWHDKPGVVSMLQQGGGPNTNGSQFTILVSPAPWLDRINVAFGLVTRGLDVVERMCEKYGADNGNPTKVVRIFDCGLK